MVPYLPLQVNLQNLQPPITCSNPYDLSNTPKYMWSKDGDTVSEERLFVNLSYTFPEF